MKELELTLRIRNNRLKERRLALGMTQNELATEIGVTRDAYGALETMRRSPLIYIDKPKARWAGVALAIARYHRVAPEELFPDTVLKVKTTFAVKRMDSRDVESLLTSAGHSLSLPPAPDEALEAKDLKTSVDEVLEILSPRQAEVLRMRFGLDGRHEQTLEEIARKTFSTAPLLGRPTRKPRTVTRELIRSIEIKALRKLRRPSIAKKLKVFIET
jgi:transcriptional regulator with XRE-family HTH domain